FVAFESAVLGGLRTNLEGFGVRRDVNPVAAGEITTGFDPTVAIVDPQVFGIKVSALSGRAFITISINKHTRRGGRCITECDGE
ncbi:hypothetical protein, partial [Enterovibrio norvegicus]|uniref:hypothetical protein n=1 Tax=Enterovibrio norvegicus TaxID=188144 RepID=UPI0013010392